MNLIAQTLADGLVLGGIYALAAVGFSLIFGVLHVINLSHGILVLMGATPDGDKEVIAISEGYRESEQS